MLFTSLPVDTACRGFVGVEPTSDVICPPVLVRLNRLVESRLHEMPMLRSVEVFFRRRKAVCLIPLHID